VEEGKLKISADKFLYHDGAMSARGHVRVEVTDMTVQSDSVDVDADQVWARFRGHVTIDTANEQTTGTELTVNLDTEGWELRDGKSVVKPAFFKQGPTEDVFATAKQIDSLPDKGEIVARGGQVTTCDLPDPHYALDSNEIDLRSDNKITFHKPTLELLGHRVAELPFNLTLSMDETKTHLLPEVGTNDVEGYYAKFAFLYLAGDSSSGVVKLNLTQKRGVGLGFDHLLEQPNQTLRASLMFEPQSKSVTADITDRMQWSQIFSSQFDTSVQQNSGYGGLSSTSISSDLTFKRSDLTSNTELGFQQGITQGSFSTGSQFQTHFSHDERDGDTQWRVQSALQRFSTGGDTPADETLQSSFDLTTRTQRFDTQILMQSYSVLSSPSAGSSSSGIERSPEITLTTDSKRMNDWGPFGILPMRTQFFLGSYKQPGSQAIQRVGFDAELGRSSYGFGSQTGLNMSGDFRQMFYSDGAAQYVAAATVQQRNDITQSWQSAIRWDFSKPNGFAPIQLDTTSYTSNLTVQVVQYMPDRRRIELSSGYDFLGNRYQDINVHGQFMTGERSELDIQGGYSLDLAQWLPVVAKWTKVVPDTRYLCLSAQYAPIYGRLAQGSLEMDYVLTPKWRFNMLTSYNGLTKQLDYADLRLVRDLHCLVAVASYSKATHEFRIDIGLKAFPSYAGPFGVGSSGAKFEGASGQYF
jgi:hypothetical protein